MKFNIDSIILWPRNHSYKYSKLKFSPEKVNIITGASRTGKSAVIPIIDYCLGSEKCSIPVDTIRDACEWFGVLFNTETDKLLLCRKAPGSASSTNQMYFSKNKSVSIPETISPNITTEEVKNILNELFSISFLSLDSSNSNNFNARPSYRDYMPFVFQPQNIIANADVLFYKADTMEHRQKLINVFPYALGAITAEILAAKQDLERKKRLKQRLENQQKNLRFTNESLKNEISSWLDIAKEYGLTSYSVKENDSFHTQFQELKLIVQREPSESKINGENLISNSDSINNLRKQEQELSSQLVIFQKRYQEMQHLSQTVEQYDSSLQIQLERLEISKWLRELPIESQQCPFCNSPLTHSNKVLNYLCDSMADIESTSRNIQSLPASFQREMQDVKKEIQSLSLQLNSLRQRISIEENKNKKESNKKYTIESIARFLGRMDTAIQYYEKTDNDSELANQIAKLDLEIKALESKIDEQATIKRIKSALRYISTESNKIILNLDAERPDDPINLNIKDLTVNITNIINGREDYLWEIGSASNWLAYHISVILALQKYFQGKINTGVPGFIVFDQPSQVYFPKSKNTTEQIEYKLTNDEDIDAVKKIFKTLSEFIKNTGFNIQIIVMEHADDDIWGDIDNIYLVDRWRNGKKLIPIEWLQ